MFVTCGKHALTMEEFKLGLIFILTYCERSLWQCFEQIVPIIDSTHVLNSNIKEAISTNNSFKTKYTEGQQILEHRVKLICYEDAGLMEKFEPRLKSALKSWLDSTNVTKKSVKIT